MVSYPPRLGTCSNRIRQAEYSLDSHPVTVRGSASYSDKQLDVSDEIQPSCQRGSTRRGAMPSESDDDIQAQIQRETIGYTPPPARDTRPAVGSHHQRPIPARRHHRLIEGDLTPYQTFREARRVSRKYNRQSERQIRRPWSIQEEEALMQYTYKFPRGAYVDMLEYDRIEGGGLLQSRSPVQLKDKVRNMVIVMIKYVSPSHYLES